MALSYVSNEFIRYPTNLYTVSYLPFLANVEYIHHRFINQMKQEFADIANIPGVVGCIDGTHIRICRPQQFEEAFVNRKNYHSINVQV
jgi:hypothetical protein